MGVVAGTLVCPVAPWDMSHSHLEITHGIGAHAPNRPYGGACPWYGRHGAPNPSHGYRANLLSHRDHLPWGMSQCGASRYETYAYVLSVPHIRTSHMGNVSRRDCLMMGLLDLGLGAVAPMPWACVSS